MATGSVLSFATSMTDRTQYTETLGAYILWFKEWADKATHESGHNDEDNVGFAFVLVLCGFVHRDLLDPSHL